MPESWYDLSRLEVMLGNGSEAMVDLHKAIELSDQRLKTNHAALDIRGAARSEAAFNSIRNTPDFQRLVPP